jgi:hypothetical protein
MRFRLADVVNWTGLVYASALSVVVSLPTFGLVDHRVASDAQPQPWVRPDDSPAVTGTPAPAPVAAVGEFRCGQSLPTGLSQNLDGVSVRVVRVTTGRHGAPRVTYELSADQPVALSHGFARVVVLNPAGVVVAGQDHAERYADMPNFGEDADLAVRTIAPGHPFRHRLPPTNTRPCPGLKWKQLLRHGDSVAVVAQGWSLDSSLDDDALVDRVEIVAGPHH